MRKLLLTLALAAPLFAADALRFRIGGPLPIASFTNTPGVSNSLLDAAASTKRISWVFQSRDAAVVTTFLFRYGVRTGTPVQHRISIQGVTVTTGMPDGTPVATAAFTPPADTTWDSKVQAITITQDGAGGSLSSYTLTKGAYYSIVIEACPGSTAPCSALTTPDGSNNSSFGTSVSGLGDAGRPGFPYSAIFSTTWSKTPADTPVYGYRSASTTYGFPLQSITASTVTVGAEQAVLFNIPSSLWSTYQVAGIRWLGSSGPTGHTWKVVLYSGTTVLAQTTLDSDMTRVASSSYLAFTAYFSDATLPTLNAGTDYRIGLAPQDTSSSIGVITLDLAAAGDRTVFPGGTAFAYSTRAGCTTACDGTGTAWAADTTTSRPMIELILADITPPTGGGGTRSFAGN